MMHPCHPILVFPIPVKKARHTATARECSGRRIERSCAGWVDLIAVRLGKQTLLPRRASAPSQESRRRPLTDPNRSHVSATATPYDKDGLAHQLAGALRNLRVAVLRDHAEWFDAQPEAGWAQEALTSYDVLVDGSSPDGFYEEDEEDEPVEDVKAAFGMGITGVTTFRCAKHDREGCAECIPGNIRVTVGTAAASQQPAVESSPGLKETSDVEANEPATATFTRDLGFHPNVLSHVEPTDVDASPGAQRESWRHELKTWPESFQAILDGHKRFEYRRNDRHFECGDTLRLREFAPDLGEYTGRDQRVTVTWVSYGPSWGIPEGFCVMSIAALDSASTEALSEPKMSGYLLAIRDVRRELPELGVTFNNFELSRRIVDALGGRERFNVSAASARADEPSLGLATTLELIMELAARAQVSRVTGEAWPSYRTVDSDDCGTTDVES